MNDDKQENKIEPNLVYGDYVVVEPGVCDAEDCVPWDKPACYDRDDLEIIVV